MKVMSENEFRDLVKRALFAARLPYGDYENSAEMMLWATMHDCADWQQFDEALQRVESSNVKLMPPRDKGRFDLKGGSLCVYGVQVGDYCMARALQNDAHTCLIHDATDPAYMGLKLVEATRQGLFGFFLWADGEDVCSYYTENVGKPPQKCVWSAKGESLQHSALVFSTSAQHTARLFNHHWSRPLEFARGTWSPDAMHERYQRNLHNGVAVPPAILFRLERQAAKLLVSNPV